MTREAINELKKYTLGRKNTEKVEISVLQLNRVIKALEQEPIDKSAMMYEIYMEGVNMSGEYQGCWVRFKKVEKIVDKYIGELK